jgi:hypothetical protein
MNQIKEIRELEKHVKTNKNKQGDLFGNINKLFYEKT